MTQKCHTSAKHTIKCFIYTDQLDTWSSVFILFGSGKYGVWPLDLDEQFKKGG